MRTLLDYSVNVRRQVRLCANGSGRYTVLTQDAFLCDFLNAFRN